MAPHLLTSTSLLLPLPLLLQGHTFFILAIMPMCLG